MNLEATERLGRMSVTKSKAGPHRLRKALAFNNIGAIYVLAVIAMVFAIWIPDVFLSGSTVKQILNSNAVIALAALSILVPLSAQVFDLSIAYTMTLSGVTVAHFVAATDVGIGVAIVLALAVALFVGLINAFVVVLLRIDSLIATLATGSLIQAFITMVTHENPITDVKLTGPFSNIGQSTIAGLSVAVPYVLVIAVVLWFVLDHTVIGRRVYATGFNQDAARLAGIRTARIRFVSLLVSAFIAGIAGIVLASNLSSGAPDSGTPYLLPAFAAAFLGATQFRGGRFNPWGTLLAVLLLGTGTTGLSLAAAPQWSGDMFTGVVLIAALAVTGFQRRAAGARRLFPQWRTPRAASPAPAQDPIPQ